MAKSAFFYGTLMHPKVLKRVIQNDGSHLQICPAVLLEHTRHRVKWREYPGAVPYEKGRLLYKRELGFEERSVRGTLVTGLTPQEMILLTDFEGDEYIRRVVDIYPLALPVDLSVYDVGSDEALIPAKPPPLPPVEALPVAVQAETYIYADHHELKAEAWSFGDFLEKNARKWYTERWAEGEKDSE